MHANITRLPALIYHTVIIITSIAEGRLNSIKLLQWTVKDATDFKKKPFKKLQNYSLGKCLFLNLIKKRCDTLQKRINREKYLSGAW